MIPNNLPRYRSHKIVEAIRLKGFEITPDGGVKLIPEDPFFPAFTVPGDYAHRIHAGDDDPGYFVRYADGYISWSPTKAFENGYTLV